MKVNGYKLRNAIQTHCNKRTALEMEWSQSLKKFPGEEKRHPTIVRNDVCRCEDDIARLQEAQSIYNLAVKVFFNGKEESLKYVISRVGGVGRDEKAWRSTLSPKDRYYNHSDDERAAGNVYAVSQLTPQESLEEARKSGKIASAAREAIAIGNSRELDIDVDPKLFE